MTKKKKAAPVIIMMPKGKIGKDDDIFSARRLWANVWQWVAITQWVAIRNVKWSGYATKDNTWEPMGHLNIT